MKFRKDRIETTIYTKEEIKEGVKLSHSEEMRRAWARRFKKLGVKGPISNDKSYWRTYQRKYFNIKPENYRK